MSARPSSFRLYPLTTCILLKVARRSRTRFEGGIKKKKRTGERERERIREGEEDGEERDIIHACV